MVITKAAHTGGLVNTQVVKEQLLYEIYDPGQYITPDVILDFTQVTVQEIGVNRVEVRGVRGGPAPQKIKATVCFDGGWKGEGEISYAGPNCLARARAAAEVLLERLKLRKLAVEARVDLIGIGSVLSGDSGTQWRNYGATNPRTSEFVWPCLHVPKTMRTKPRAKHCKRPPIPYGVNAGNGLNGGWNRRGGGRFDWCLPVMRQQCCQVFVQ